MDLVPGLPMSPLSLGHGFADGVLPSPLSEHQQTHVCNTISEGGAIYLRLHWNITLPVVCALLGIDLAMHLY